MTIRIDIMPRMALGTEREIASKVFMPDTLARLIAYCKPSQGNRSKFSHAEIEPPGRQERQDKGLNRLQPNLLRLFDLFLQ